MQHTEMTPPDRRHLTNFVRRHLNVRLESEVDDIVQHAIIVIERKKHTWNGTAKFSTWCFGIALNTCINVNRRFGPRLDIVVQIDDLGSDDEFTALTSSYGESTVDIIERRQRMDEIAKWVASLPKCQRDVIELLADGSKQEDIAAKLGVPIGTIKSRISRARESYHA